MPLEMRWTLERNALSGERNAFLFKIQEPCSRIGNYQQIKNGISPQSSIFGQERLHSLHTNIFGEKHESTSLCSLFYPQYILIRITGISHREKSGCAMCLVKQSTQPKLLFLPRMYQQ